MTAIAASGGDSARLAALLPFALLLAVLPFPGTVALRLLCLVGAAAVAAAYIWRQPADRPALPGKPALAAWIAVSGASLAGAMDPAYSLGELKNEIGYAMLAFMSFLVIARDRQDVEHLLLALAAGFVVIGGWAAGAWLLNGFCWTETGGHGGIGSFSTYLVTVMPALLWLAMAGSRPALRRAAIGLLLFALLLALITLQRAIWPALAAEAAIFAFWRYRRGRFGRRQLLQAALGVALIVTAFYAASAWRGPGQSVEASLMADTRLPAWRGVVAKIAEHPLVGAGFGRSAMKKAYPELVPPDNPAIWHPHNVFLNYAIGMGLPGLAVLAWLFVSFGHIFWRQTRHADEGLALLGVCGAMLVAGVVVRNQFNDLFMRDMALLYWALAGIFLGQASRITERQPR